ncbi:unnamed protein product [Lampetra fluviatilis]
MTRLLPERDDNLVRRWPSLCRSPPPRQSPPPQYNAHAGVDSASPGAPGSAEDVEHATNTLSLCNVYFAWMHLATLNEDTSSPSAGRMCSSQLRSIQHCSSELPSSKLRRSELRSIELDSSELRSRIMLCSLTR